MRIEADHISVVSSAMEKSLRKQFQERLSRTYCNAIKL